MEHHLFWLIYPSGLTPQVQRLLGVGVIVINLALYAWVRSRRKADLASRARSQPAV
jgi:hypothetical protein